MSNNHRHDRVEMKPRKAKVHPQFEESSGLSDKIRNEYEERSGVNNKVKGVKKNTVHLLATIKEGVARWRKHVAARREVTKVSGDGDHDGHGLCGEGNGLAPIDEQFAPEDLKPSEQKQALVASKKLHEYFTLLQKASHLERYHDAKGAGEEHVSVNLDQIEECFRFGARIDWPDEEGQTVFHEAVRAWRGDVAEYLLERGGRPEIINTPDKWGRTPLHMAAIVNNGEVAKLLLENGANKEARTNGEDQTPVHFAAKFDSYDVMKILIKARCEYKDIRDYKGRTPLQLAAEYGVSHMVSLLLELNAPANVQDFHGQTAIVLIMKNTRALANDAMDQFIKHDSLHRQQTAYVNYMVPRPAEHLKLPSHAQSPLEVITTNRFYDLVMHDIVKEVIRIKWKHFGKCGAVATLILNLIFNIIWTVLGIYPDWTTRYKYAFPHDVWRVFLWVVAIALTGFEVFHEIIEYKVSRSKLDEWKKWKHEQLKLDLAFCHPQWPNEEKHLRKRLEYIEREKTQYIKDWWNVWDWICYVCLFACIVTHLTDIFLPVHSVELSRTHVRIMVFTLIFIWFRLLKSARAFSPIGPFIVILGQMIGDIGKFAFLYIDLYVPYVAGFWMIFGGRKIKNEFLLIPLSSNATDTTVVVPGYQNLHKILFSVFRLTLVDEYPYEDMNEVDPIMSDILIATWFALSAILCINLFIALLSDTFQRVYDNAQANGLMLKAMTIMDIEGRLAQKRLKKHMDFIHNKGNGLVSDYSEKLPKRESDLKKVAFQVKYELEEMRDWFTDKFGPVQHAHELSGLLTSGWDSRRGSILSSTDVGYLKSEILGIKQDMASLKTMLQLFINSRDGGGGGSRGVIPDAGIVGDVVDGDDRVDRGAPYIARSESLIPLYDAEEYRSFRDVERRHTTRRSRRKKKKHSRLVEEVDDVDPRGLRVSHTTPIAEVDSYGFMEPPPQQIGRLQTTPDPEHPDSTEA